MDGFADGGVVGADGELHGDLLGGVDAEGETDEDLRVADEDPREEARVGPRVVGDHLRPLDPQG